MPSLALKAHFDGKQILLDEPYPLPLAARLMVLVMPDSDDEEARAGLEMAATSLNRAYGEDEPEYTLADLRRIP